MDVALGVACALGGCQLNIGLLELIAVGTPNVYYGLTFLQYVTVAVLSFPLLLRWRVPGEEPAAAFGALQPWCLRPLRLAPRKLIILAVWSWAVSVANNAAFGFRISVPAHATWRSASLLLNMLAGRVLLGRAFSLPQVAAAVVVCAGLVTLTVEKAQRVRARTRAAGSSASPEAQEAAEALEWVCGTLLLVGTAACMAVMSVYQERVFHEARSRPPAPRAGGRARAAPPPMWLEALWVCHTLGAPLFLTQPRRLMRELTSLASAPRSLVVGNCLTQLTCIMGVFVLSDTTSATTTALVLTLRKLMTFIFSVAHFGHYKTLSAVEWAAMASALAAASVYPFLPRVAANSAATAAARKQSGRHE